MIITVFQRHPSDGEIVILHIDDPLVATGDGTIEVVNQEYRDALEAASADSEHPFFEMLVD